FLGGGTPSLVPPPLLVSFLARLAEIFPLAAGAAGGLEADPPGLGDAPLAPVCAAGVARLSLRGPAPDAPAPRAVDRGHAAEDGLAALRRAGRAGFSNRSADLLLAIPGESEARFLDSLDRVLAEGVPHLSVYALSIEEKSVFGRRARAGRFAEESDER